MLQILRKSDNLIIVIHEIYGINQHIKNFCDILSKQDFDVICPNLLEREQSFDYSEEKIAYHNFMETVGFSDAADKIKNLLAGVKNKYQKIYIIGFSVGATIAWLCSEEDCLPWGCGILWFENKEFHENSTTMSYNFILSSSGAII